MDKLIKRGIHKTLSKFTQSTHHEFVQAKHAIMTIPSHSTVLIGGFSNRQVPNNLIEILSGSQCDKLTILTNACIQNTALKSLIADSRKVKRLLTCLESNSNCSNVDVNMIDSIEFTKSCSTYGLGEYALIRSNRMDSNGWHYWSGPSLGNALMAKWTKFFSVAQYDNCADSSQPSAIALNKIFVKYSTHINEKKTEDVFTNDSKFEYMVTRALLELKNNNVVMFSEKVN